ncbi:hypothetical protein GRF59_20960 [Paenibacillus sp. HJL G12]|uniref:Uncharacterized protein n=1 Tax=Paenibacillus dendrobii TaxID=2691084 RepID=A0A7X3INU4_9BACL|nr:hypothetical protein [Paenibacillus dendrobii]MWV46095.1 hypothetical protein [Paenibacillus dendrobii]
MDQMLVASRAAVASVGAVRHAATAQADIRAIVQETGANISRGIRRSREVAGDEVPTNKEQEYSPSVP